MAGRGEQRPPYEVVVRLHAVAIDEWPAIDGTCAAAGIDPFALSPNRFCNLIYAWALARVEDRTKFDAQLTMPLPGRERRAPTPAVRAKETGDLMAMASWASSMQQGRG